MKAWNEPYKLQQVFNNLAAPKTVFNLNFNYRVGLGELDVYFNGIPAVIGSDYTETDMYTVTFTFPVEPGDTVLFRKRKY